jgi:hypothetical protein
MGVMDSLMGDASAGARVFMPQIIACDFPNDAFAPQHAENEDVAIAI